MKKRTKNILSSLIIPSILAVICFAVILIFQFISTTGAEDETYEKLKLKASQQVQIIRTMVNEQFIVLETLANGCERISSSYGDKYIVSMLNSSNEKSDYNHLYIAYPDENDSTAVNAYFSDGTVLKLDKSDCIAKAFGGENAFSYERESKADGKAEVSFAVPVTVDGKISSVIVGAFDEAAFKEKFMLDNDNENDYAFITDREGNTIIESSNSFYLGQSDAGKNVINWLYSDSEMMKGFSAGQVKTDLLNGLSGQTAYYASDDEERVGRYAVYQPIGENDWFFFNVTTGSEVTAYMNETTRNGLVLIIVFAVTSIAIIFTIAYTTSRRNRELEGESNKLKRSEEMYAIVEKLSDTIIFDANIETDELSFKATYEQKFGHKSIANKISEINLLEFSVYEEDRKVLSDLSRSYKELDEDSYTCELRILIGNTGYRWFKVEYFAIRKDNIICRLIGKIIDIDEEKRSHEQLVSRAERDSLTGALNHEATKMHIDRFIQGEGKHRVHALFIVDFDNFKLVNDNFGHAEGDKTLISMSDELHGIFRATDIVGRIGGDEFVVFLKNITTENLIRLKATEVCETLQYTRSGNGKQFQLTCSVGIAVFDGNNDNPLKTFDDLYKEADDALYEAKHQGKNRFVFSNKSSAFYSSKAEEELKSISSTNVQLRALLEHIDGGVFLFEIGEKVKPIYTSPSYYKVAKITPEAFKEYSDDVLPLIHPDDRESVELTLRQGGETGKAVDVIYRNIYDKNTVDWRHIRAVRIPYADSQYPVLIAVIMDITSQKNSAIQLQAIVDNLPGGVGIFEVGECMKMTFANDFLLDMVGCSIESYNSIINIGGNIIVHPDDMPMVREKIDEAVKTDKPQEIIVRTCGTNDINTKWVMLRGVTIGMTNGHPLVIVIVIDITDIKRLEIESESSRGKLAVSSECINLAFDQTKAIAWELDLEKKQVSFWDTEKSEFEEQKELRDIPKCFLTNNRIHPDSIAEINAFFNDIFSGKSKGNCAVLASKNTGKYVWLKLSYRLICDKDGNPYKAVGIREEVPNIIDAKYRFEQEEVIAFALRNEINASVKVNYSTGFVERAKGIHGDIFEDLPITTIDEMLAYA